MKRIIAIWLTVILLFAVIPAHATTDNMADAIQMLSTFMSASEAVPVDINEIIDNFAQFGNMDRAVEFKFYSTMMKYIVEGDFEHALNYLKVLETLKFDDYLGSDAFKSYMVEHGILSVEYPNIRPTSEARSYIEGRKAFNEGRIGDAYKAFVESLHFYDAGDYLNQAMGGMEKSNDELYTQALSVYAAGNIDGALQILVKIKEFHEKSQALYDVLITEKEQTVATPNPTLEPTPTPTPTPTETPSSNNQTTNSSGGYWTEWSASMPPSGAKSETKKQYRGRGVTTKYRSRTLTQQTTRNQELSGATLVSTYNETGNWSDWSDNATSSSATLEVETRIVNATSIVTKYHYSRYRYINKQGNWNSAPVDASNPSSGLHNYLRDGRWEYDTVDVPKAVSRVNSWNGYTSYAPGGGYAWWNETMTQEEVVTGTKTQYRSRPIYVVRVYNVWSAWSSWSTTKATASATCEVQTDTEYGSWSNWGDKVLSASANYQVENRTLYRYWVN